MFKERVPAFILFILDRLRAFNHQAFIVGGAVRDALLGRPIWDWDVATSASPQCVSEIFRPLRQVAFKGGTTVLVHEGHHFEITAFRGADHSIVGDLAGRDFTIDAMAYDDVGDLVLDPFDGQKDLLEQRVKAVGEARARFDEDPLRIIRAVRLAAELSFTIEPATAEVISRMTHHLEKVAPERTREELVRILVTPKPSEGLRLMDRLGILGAILPELAECGTVGETGGTTGQSVLDHLFETSDLVEATPHMRLAALFHDVAKPSVKVEISGKWHFPGHAEASAMVTEEIMRRLKFSRKRVTQVSALTRYHHFTHTMGENSDLMNWIRCVGKDRVRDLIALRRADLLAHELQRECGALSRFQKRIAAVMMAPMVLTPADLAIDGKTVMDTLGLRQGPLVGEILRELMAFAARHPSQNDEDSLKALLLEIKRRGGRGLETA